MPVNDRYPLADVLAECRRYVELRGRKVYVEYVMLEGVNDTPRHAAELAAILDPKSFKVNLIPYNPTGMYGGSSRDAIAAFKHVLDRARIPATVTPDARPGHRSSLRAAGRHALTVAPHCQASESASAESAIAFSAEPYRGCRRERCRRIEPTVLTGRDSGRRTSAIRDAGVLPVIAPRSSGRGRS